METHFLARLGYATLHPTPLVSRDGGALLIDPVSGDLPQLSVMKVEVVSSLSHCQLTF